jgi:hypothetical protein
MKELKHSSFSTNSDPLHQKQDEGDQLIPGDFGWELDIAGY